MSQPIDHPSRGAADWIAALCWAPLLLLPGCHDSPRSNPLDPQLTPAVELTVALDDSAGTAALTWTRYEGRQPLAAYWVLRNVTRSTEVDTLARLAAMGETSYRDTTLAPDTAYEYRVAAVNTRGFAAVSSPQRVDGYTTRAVQLLPLQIEPETGTVRLTWRRYRDPGFTHYQVRRRQLGTDQEEVLAVHPEPADTTFADTTARHQVEYAYTAMVEAADRTLTSNSREGRMELPPVTVQADFDSRTASAALTWTRYRGPWFAEYQVWRRSEELTSQLVAEIVDPTVTTVVDSSLHGNTQYLYHLTVTTSRGEEVIGPPINGAFHELVSLWPLECMAGDQVRLYAEPGGRIGALVAGIQRVHWLEYETSGALLTDQELLRYCPPARIEPWAVAAALTPELTHHLSLPVGDSLCLPRSTMVLAQFYMAEPKWPGLFTPRIGTGIGQGDGEFILPLSFDLGLDMRLFVLDAGNARVQAFSRSGAYLTQWGTRGSGPGQFDFGGRQRYQDLAGSIAVDPDGYIDVADPGNRRIQKFAP